MSQCSLCHKPKDRSNPLTWILMCDLHEREECYGCFRQSHYPIPYFEDELRKRRPSKSADNYN